MNNSMQAIRKHRITKHKPRVSDGIKHPVTITTARERVLDKVADMLTALVIGAIDAHDKARKPAVEAPVLDIAMARKAMEAPVNTKGVCGNCGQAVRKVWHPSLGNQPRWLHESTLDTGIEHCSMVRNVMVQA
jgi:hypothetical protein